MSAPKRSRLGVNTAPHGVMKTHLNWYWRLNPALNNGAGTCQPPSSPTRATIDPDAGAVVGSLRSTGDKASSDSDSSREKVADSDMDTASGDCVSCSDTDEVSVQTSQKKYQRRVWASCGLYKGSIWTEAQLKKDWQKSPGNMGTQL